MYTCTIPDENGVTQTLIVWAAGIAAYGGTNGNREFNIEQLVTRTLITYLNYSIHSPIINKR